MEQLNNDIMNVESVRDYCLSLPAASEYFPFDETTLAFRVVDKIFAMIDLEDTQWFVLKCDPDYALELRGSCVRELFRRGCSTSFSGWPGGCRNYVRAGSFSGYRYRLAYRR